MPAPRSYNVAPALGVGVAVAAVVGTVVSSASDLSGMYALRATMTCTVFLVTVARAAGHEHPFPCFGAANVVTTARAVLTTLVAGLVGIGDLGPFLWPSIVVVGCVAALDGVDGWLARRGRMDSGFGARFDMETDALLILVLSVLVWQNGKAGVWVLLCGGMRYLFVAAGWALPWLAGRLRSTRRGKTVAVAQFAGLGVALMPVVAPSVCTWVAGVTLAALTWSFAVDVLWLRREASALEP